MEEHYSEFLPEPVEIVSAALQAPVATDFSVPDLVLPEPADPASPRESPGIEMDYRNAAPGSPAPLPPVHGIEYEDPTWELFEYVGGEGEEVQENPLPAIPDGEVEPGFYGEEEIVAEPGPYIALEEFDPEENEDGMRRRLSYRVENEETVLDVVEYLSTTTSLDIEVREETFYSEEEFEYGGETMEPGTHSAYEFEIEGMDYDSTEFLVNGDLAEDSIDTVEVTPGDVVEFVDAAIYGDGDVH